MQEINSLPVRMPGWMAARPHLASRLLLLRNAYRYRRPRVLVSAALIVAGCAVAAMLPPTGPILQWLSRNWAVTFAVATCGFAVSTARLRQHASIGAATSWLAALPTTSPPCLQIVAGIAGRLAAMVAFTAVAWGAGAIDRATFSRLAFAAAAGAVVGLLGGWRLSRAGIGAPGFHYAIVRRPRAGWASAPSLSPLGCWPAAQGRVFSRPKKVAPILLLAMLAIPAGAHGAPGQVALAVAGACVALFSLLSLSVAAVRVAFEATHWLAPTALGKWRFIGALIWRVMLTQAMIWVVLIFLAGVVDLSRALAVGAPLAAVYLCASLGAAVVAALQACHRMGLGVSGRGV